jgi:hypothetical protein
MIQCLRTARKNLTGAGVNTGAGGQLQYKGTTKAESDTIIANAKEFLTETVIFINSHLWRQL